MRERKLANEKKQTDQEETRLKKEQKLKEEETQRLKEEEQRLVKQETQKLKKEEKRNLKEERRLIEQEKQRLKGKVKWFNGVKGYGFIEMEGEEKDIFVHSSAVKNAGIKYLREGEQLTFEVEATEKGPSAINLQKKS